MASDLKANGAIQKWLEQKQKISTCSPQPFIKEK